SETWSRTWLTLRVRMGVAMIAPFGSVRCRTRSVEAALGFGVHVRRQWALQQHVDVVLEMLGIDRADYVRVQIRMREREAQDELHGGHAFEQIIEVHVPPPLPLHSGLLSLGGRALGRAAPNDDAGSRLRRRRDERLVL